MQSAEFIKNLDKRFTKLESHFKQVVQGFDIDAIHDFRVEVKKIRALLRLMGASLSHPQLKIPGTVKTFYTCIGTIRNLQLQQVRLKATAGTMQWSSQYLEYLRFEEGIQKKRANELAKEVTIEVLQERVLKTAPGLLNKESPRAFVAQKHGRLQQLVMIPLPGDEDIHNIRKTVKDLLYTWKFIETEAVVVLPVPLASAEKMDELARILGDYCDLCVSLSMLEAVPASTVVTEGESQGLMVVSQQLEMEKLVMKERLWEGLGVLRSSEVNVKTNPGTSHTS